MVAAAFRGCRTTGKGLSFQQSGFGPKLEPGQFSPGRLPQPMPSMRRFGLSRRRLLRAGFLARPAAVLIGCGLIAAVVSAAQRPARPAGGDNGPGGQLWISATPLDAARQLLIVIDPHGKNAAIYHVDAAAGTLALKSTRDITWDLLVGDFNAQEPRPAALKKMLEIGREQGPDGQNRP
jgi:hypothetical protein